MKTYARYVVLSLLVFMSLAFAQTTPASTDGNPAFTQQELDQMLAPIALYPDPLLSQMLMAATYPLEVVEAARWSRANPSLTGKSATEAASSQPWDPSVKSLIAFPQVLQTMDQKIDWTERLGDAFLAQQAQVMDTIQSLRHKANATGLLASSQQADVVQTGDVIEIEAQNPDVVYVPYYEPTLVYGPWWWPDYPPVFWEPWIGYGWYGDFAWGLGIDVGGDFFFGSWDWHNHRVYARGSTYHDGVGAHTWQHDPSHRRGVPYRNAPLNQRFGRVPAVAPRAEFRGYAPPSYTGTSRSEPVQTGPLQEPRANAFENVGRGAETRGFSARGHESSPGRMSFPVSAPSHVGHH
jgi:hypothetical protein